MERKSKGSKGSMAYKMKGSSMRMVEEKTGEKRTSKKPAAETPEGGPAASEPFQEKGRLYKMVNGKKVDITPS